MIISNHQDQDQISWNDVPEIIKRHIIEYNPSLKKIHNDSLKPTLNDIKRLRRDKQCTDCVRKCVFNMNSQCLLRKPSVRMYVVIAEAYTSNTDHVRVRCMCAEHFRINPGEIVMIVPKDLEYPSPKFKIFLKTLWEDIVSIIVFHGVDEDDIFALNRKCGGVNSTLEFPRPTWKRYILGD